MLEVAPLLAPPPGDPTGSSYISERLALRARLEADENAAQSRDFSQPETLSGIFVSMGVPASVAKVGAEGGQPDDWFAEQRLTGLNPLLIARLGSKNVGAAPDGFVATKPAFALSPAGRGRSSPTRGGSTSATTPCSPTSRRRCPPRAASCRRRSRCSTGRTRRRRAAAIRDAHAGPRPAGCSSDRPAPCPSSCRWRSRRARTVP
jgi:hypothetical protein